MQPEELDSPGYELLGEVTHATLIEFVLEYFLRRTSWLTWLHHAMSVATFAAIVFVAVEQQRSVVRCLGDFALAVGTLVLVILPLHEALHALAYRLVGARDVRWNYSWKMAAVWVIAHRFVAGRGAFLFVALAPFAVLNALLIARALLSPQYAVYLLFVLLWHLHGCAGDWSMVNFVWLHRRRGFWTYDDAVLGRSFFYGRSA